MEELLQFKELGIAGIAVGALAYICYKLIIELKDSRINYQSFVQDNNHTTTELVREATAQIAINNTQTMETNKAIAQHNELLKIMLEKIK